MTYETITDLTHNFNVDFNASGSADDMLLQRTIDHLDAQAWLKPITDTVTIDGLPCSLHYIENSFGEPILGIQLPLSDQPESENNYDVIELDLYTSVGKDTSTVLIKSAGKELSYVDLMRYRSLTETERKILRNIDKANSEIAYLFGVDVETITTHLGNMRRDKFQTKNQAEMLRLALDLHLIDLPTADNYTSPTYAEQQVLADLVAGLSYKEIAAYRGVEVSTIRTHANNLFNKFDATHRRQLFLRAESIGAVALPTMHK